MMSSGADARKVLDFGINFNTFDFGIIFTPYLYVI